MSDPEVQALAERLPGSINFRFLPPRPVNDPIWTEIAAELYARGVRVAPSPETPYFAGGEPLTASPSGIHKDEAMREANRAKIAAHRVAPSPDAPSRKDANRWRRALETAIPWLEAANAETFHSSELAAMAEGFRRALDGAAPSPDAPGLREAAQEMLDANIAWRVKADEENTRRLTVAETNVMRLLVAPSPDAPGPHRHVCPWCDREFTALAPERVPATDCPNGCGFTVEPGEGEDMRRHLYECEPVPATAKCARCGAARDLSPDGTCWPCAVAYRDEIIGERRADVLTVVREAMAEWDGDRGPQDEWIASRLLASEPVPVCIGCDFTGNTAAVSYINPKCPVHGPVPATGNPEEPTE